MSRQAVPVTAASPLLRTLFGIVDRTTTREAAMIKIGYSAPVAWRWATGKNDPSLLAIEALATSVGMRIALVDKPVAWQWLAKDGKWRNCRDAQEVEAIRSLKVTMRPLFATET